MRVIVMVVAALFALVGSAAARLGETETQCDRRYGPPVSEERTEERVVKTYAMDDYTIRAVMMRESYLVFRTRYRAIALNITRHVGVGEENIPIEQDAIAEILRANGGGLRWNEINPTLEAARRTTIEEQSNILNDALLRTRWTRPDGATAIYSKRECEFVLRMPWSGDSSEKSEAAAHGF